VNLELHWSALSMLMRCPAQYEFRYVRGVKRPPGIAAHVGSGVHASAEFNLSCKMNEGKPAYVDFVKDVARDTVVRKIETEGVLLSEDEQQKGLGAVKGEAVDKATRLALLHYDELAPHIEPVGIEIPWTVEVSGADVSLAGRIDLEVEGGIRDLKTASKSPASDAAHKADQLTVYALSYFVLRGKLPTVLGLDYLVDKTTPELTSQETTRTQDDFKVLLNRISTAVKLIQSGIFMPCARDSWVCSPRFCGFYPDCNYVK
jgi:hypothetical protein